MENGGGLDGSQQIILHIGNYFYYYVGIFNFSNNLFDGLYLRTLYGYNDFFHLILLYYLFQISYLPKMFQEFFKLIIFVRCCINKSYKLISA